MMPVKIPAIKPATNASGKVSRGDIPDERLTAVTTPPNVKLPSVVISGMLNILNEIKIPIASAEKPSPSKIAVR